MSSQRKIKACIMNSSKLISYGKVQGRNEKGNKSDMEKKRDPRSKEEEKKKILAHFNVSILFTFSIYYAILSEVSNHMECIKP